MSYADFADYYDRLMGDVDYAAIAHRLSCVIRRERPKAALVVDLACGTGKLTEYLIDDGFDVIGVDGSAQMLAVAQERLMGRALLLNQRMERLDLYGTVDAVVCTLDSISHITDESALAKAFARVSLFLEDNGLFIFDVNTLYKHTQVLGNNIFVMDEDDVYCVWSNQSHDDIVDINLDFFERDGRVYHRTSESFSERAYSMQTIERLLFEYEFDIIEINDEYTENPPCETTQRLVYTVRRRSRT